MATIIVPRLPGQRGRLKAPRLVIPRPSHILGEERPGMGVARLEKEGGDIGPGPWAYRGKKASSAEFRCLKILEELGWSPEFQVRKFGGKMLAGGQVLDILVTQRNPPVYIDVRGYYHQGAMGEADDARKIMQVRMAAPTIKIVVVWEDEAKNRDLLYQRLLSKVGARGG